MLEIAEDVFQISVFPRQAVNAYLIGSIIVDSGVRSSAAGLKKALGRRSLTAHILTHAHADHLTAAPYLKQHLGGKTAIGDHISGVQKVFKGIFNMEASFKLDGSQFDHLFADGDTIAVGGLRGRAIYVPGHTPACVAYQFGDAVLVGEFIVTAGDPVSAVRNLLVV